MTDTDRIIAEHQDLVARIADGDGDALRELMNLVAAVDAAERRPPADG